MWGAITGALMNNNIPLINVNIIAYPWPKLDYGLTFILYASFMAEQYTLKQFISLMEDLEGATGVFLLPPESGPQDINVI